MTPKGWWKKYTAQQNVQKQAAEGRFTYDEAGNMTSAFGQKYVWNADGRLQEVHKSGTKLAEYLYDEEGKRIIKYDYKENEATYYVGKLFEISYEIGSAGPKNWVSYYFCNNERVAQNKTKIPSQFPNLPTSELLFKHGDHLGSASVQTDSSGNLKQRIQYYPYGGDRYEYNAPGMDGEDIKHRFTDHEKDFAIGIYYAQARYYDQRLGRFISCDAHPPDLNDPQGLNPYHYCLNNPIKYIDPTGLDIKWAKQKGGTDAQMKKSQSIFNKALTRRNSDGTKPRSVKRLEKMQSDKTKTTTIKVGNQGNSANPENNNWKDAADPKKGANAEVLFNPDKTGKYSDGTKRDPESSLVHETAGHAYEFNHGMNSDPNPNKARKDAELSASDIENEHRNAKGIDQRKKYGAWSVKQHGNSTKQKKLENQNRKNTNSRKKKKKEKKEKKKKQKN